MPYKTSYIYLGGKLSIYLKQIRRVAPPHSLLKNYRGKVNRSGKKRFTSIKIPAVINSQTAARTGAVERYFTKSCIVHLLQTD